MASFCSVRIITCILLVQGGWCFASLSVMIFFGACFMMCFPSFQCFYNHPPSYFSTCSLCYSSHLFLLRCLGALLPACPWGRIGKVVKIQLNLTLWHYTVNLRVDRCCSTVPSVTAQEADGRLGRKPPDAATVMAQHQSYRNRKELPPTVVSL